MCSRSTGKLCLFMKRKKIRMSIKKISDVAYSLKFSYRSTIYIFAILCTIGSVCVKVLSVYEEE